MNIALAEGKMMYDNNAKTVVGFQNYSVSRNKRLATKMKLRISTHSGIISIKIYFAETSKT